MKKVCLALIAGLFLAACGGGSDQSAPPYVPIKDRAEQTTATNNKGFGEYTNVNLNDPLEQPMIESGKAIYEMKCAACHKLSAQRVVGPGWAGITQRRTPEWIMNMTTNVDVMLEKDPAARALLEECLVRMPNQNLTGEDARDVLEFMYHNDQEK